MKNKLQEGSVKVENALTKLKFRKLLIIELISIIISLVVYKSLPMSNDYIILIDIYVVPTVWIIYGLSKYGSSIKEWFKPIECKYSEIIIAIIMTFILFGGMYLIISIPISFFGDVGERTAYYIPSEFSLIAIITSVIIAPIAEELFFRGYVLNKLMIKGNIKKAIILSSLLFGIVHLLGGINATIGGFCGALLYVKYKNLYLSMILHSSYNGLLLIYKLCIYKYNFQISTQVATILLVITVILVIVSIIWLVQFIRRNSDIFKNNKDLYIKEQEE